MTTLTIILLILGWLILGLIAAILDVKFRVDNYTVKQLVITMMLGGLMLPMAIIVILAEAKFWSKKVFLILLLVGLFSSCTYNKVKPHTKIPSVVQEYVQKADTSDLQKVYVYKDRLNPNRDYYFNENKQLIEKYNSESESFSVLWMIMALIIGVTLIIGVEIGSN